MEYNAKDGSKFSSLFKELVIRDTYLIRNLKSDIDFVIDIGSNVGIFSIYSRFMFPNAKIIAIEPDKCNYGDLIKNVKNLDVDCENAALGNGSDVCFIDTGGGTGIVQSFDDEPTNANPYVVRSISLKDIFKKYNFETCKNYIIKLDCEGGERFFLNGDNNDIVRKCKHFCMEIHFPNPRFKQFDKFHSFEEYNNWVQSFSDTHKIIYHHSNRKNGTGVYVLSKQK